MVDIQSARREMLFTANMSARYHRRRAAFLETANNLSNFAVLAGGTGAFVSLYGQETWVAKTLALLLTLIGIVQIVYSPQTSAMRHKDWLAKWMSLAREIQLDPSPTVEKVDEWARRQDAIEADCTLEMRALQADCYNRTVRAMNLEEVHNYRLRWWHRRFCQMVRFEHAFEDVND